MEKFCFKKLLHIIDKIEFEEIRPLCDRKKCCEEKIKKEIFRKIKKEVR